jgi:hypothetical protein
LGKIGTLAKILGKAGISAKNLGKSGILAKNLGKMWFLEYILFFFSIVLPLGENRTNQNRAFSSADVCLFYAANSYLFSCYMHPEKFFVF